MVAFSFVVVGCADPASGPSRDGPPQYVLSDEHARVIDLDSPNVLYRVGDSVGPGMIHQGTSMMMAPVEDGGFLAFTAYFGDGPIQHFRDGELHRVFGRRGQGPGEFTSIHGLGVGPQSGAIWVMDGMRMVSFTAEGQTGPTLNRSYVGTGASGFIVLEDGSLLFAGPGSSPENLGYLLHRYDVQAGTWASFHPVFRDSVFSPILDVRRWWRMLARMPDGRVAVTSHGYVIEVLDPQRDFEVDARIVRRPEGWPDDIFADLESRRERDPLAPPFAVNHTWVDARGRLWVLAQEPKPDWQDDLVPVTDDPGHGLEMILPPPDFGNRALVEEIDLATKEVVASYRLPFSARFVVGIGKVARYAGDLPFPQIEVIQFPVHREGTPP